MDRFLAHLTLLIGITKGISMSKTIKVTGNPSAEEAAQIKVIQTLRGKYDARLKAVQSVQTQAEQEALIGIVAEMANPGNTVADIHALFAKLDALLQPMELRHTAQTLIADENKNVRREELRAKLETGAMKVVGALNTGWKFPWQSAQTVVNITAGATNEVLHAVEVAPEMLCGGIKTMVSIYHNSKGIGVLPATNGFAK